VSPSKTHFQTFQTLNEGVHNDSTITTEPNSLIAPIHDRMLIVLNKADWPVWLGEQPGDPKLLLRPPPADVLQCRPLGEREARSQRSLL
jgi:putative SOS response-associated peptidase YedK